MMEIYKIIPKHDMKEKKGKRKSISHSRGTQSFQGKTDDESIENLAFSLGAQAGFHKISLELIDRDKHQPRTVFPRATIKERMESLRRYGQKVPVIIIPQENGRFKIFDGELRYRAAQSLNWKFLDSVFISPRDITESLTVFENQVITSIHAQRLHDLDLANALIKLLSERHVNFQGIESRIPTFLNTTIRRLNRKHELKRISEIRLETTKAQVKWLESLSFKTIEEKQIFELLLELQLNPISINSNVFPLLKLSDDLVESIQIEGLGSSKAREINKISSGNLRINEAKALEIRTELIEQVLAKKLSLTQTRSLVKEILNDYRKTKGKKNSDPRIENIESIDVASIQDLILLNHLKVVINAKLKEVKAAIQSLSTN